MTATFIVDSAGDLWIADRHSEHVCCARGGTVLSAGEITFSDDGGRIEVVAATNQSTGYCPEPESWLDVQRALERARLPHPDDFTGRFLFRRCPSCGMRNLVKDDWFVCGVCDTTLPEVWNFGPDG